MNTDFSLSTHGALNLQWVACRADRRRAGRPLERIHADDVSSAPHRGRMWPLSGHISRDFAPMTAQRSLGAPRADRRTTLVPNLKHTVPGRGTYHHIWLIHPWTHRTIIVA